MSVSKIKMNTAISWFILAYFIILFVERAQSIVRILLSSEHTLTESGFANYVNMLTIASLVVFLMLIIGFNGDFWRSLFNNSVQANYSMLCITAGVILVGGMVHTEYTIAPVQFASYGMIIVAMVLRTIEISGTGPSTFKLWYRLIYLTAFSMAIPVVYHSDIKNALAFHIIEAVVSLALVAMFTLLLREMFLGEGANLLLWVPIIICVVGDAIVLALRWHEQVNMFVLIFVIASAVLFAIGKVVFAIIK